MRISINEFEDELLHDSISRCGADEISGFDNGYLVLAICDLKSRWVNAHLRISSAD